MEAASFDTAPMTEASRAVRECLPTLFKSSRISGPDATFFSSSYTMNCIAPCDTCTLEQCSVCKIYWPHKKGLHLGTLLPP